MTALPEDNNAAAENIKKKRKKKKCAAVAISDGEADVDALLAELG